MDQDIMNQISSEFYHLCKFNNLYNHWIHVLYHPDGLNEEEWNIDNLKKMRQDAQSMNILFTI